MTGCSRRADQNEWLSANGWRITKT
ncbi:MAG: DUF4224 domain-containing protein [Rhodoferax sp.]|nr:DUF4224 domain-containing protein [Rhodoferax sp.]